MSDEEDEVLEADFDLDDHVLDDDDLDDGVLGISPYVAPPDGEDGDPEDDWAASGASPTHLRASATGAHLGWKTYSVERFYDGPPIAAPTDDALATAGVVELEPWVALEVLAPAASSNAVLADLGARGAEMNGVSAGRQGARLTGRAPLARMLGYVTRLRSITKGLGQVSMRPDGFAAGSPGAGGAGGTA